MYDRFRRPEVVVYFVSQDRVDDPDLHEEVKTLIRIINNIQGIVSHAHYTNTLRILPTNH